ncbi:MAG: hypothetical protein JO307_01280 [Bryobacterales bacterium]|nr:hypothetical protein [Bryobacterales bacterium]MBV9396586.1 hypothetical protein [Bryobacterales bacterium]
MRYFRRLGVPVIAALLGGLASSQAPVDVQIDDTGTVIAAHQQRHVTNGQAVRWRRVTTGSWHVVFRQSPCQNGLKEFGTVGGRPQTCTISVHCAKPGDASCHYKYSSATAPGATLHDPEIIVDN